MEVLTQRDDGAVIDPRTCAAVILDMDGVLTSTARLHARAWKSTFDAYLSERAAGEAGEGDDYAPFDLDTDYPRYVDGVSRLDGVRRFLASRDITLEEGDPDDPPERETVHGIGRRKNDRFLELLDEVGAHRHDDGVALVRALRDAGIRTAVISASRNAERVLEDAGLTGLFDARVDGMVAAELGLPGKPAPDVLCEAARRLDVAPERALIVEDAIAGVEAGRRGGFAAVIGVARRADPDALRAAGADVVLEDLSAIRVEGAEEQADEGRSIEALPDALARLDDVMAEIADRRVALFLDFDGTLAPIVDHPDRAAVPEETRALLADVASRRAVAVVSGRDLDDLRSRIDVDDVYYAGSHGFRLAGPDGWSREQPRARAFLPALEEAAKALEEALATREGVEIERKRYAVAVHHRRAPADAEEEVRREVEAVCERSDGALRVGEGRSVLELRPAIDWDKGSAVGWMREELGLAGADVCPVYLGDDVTDEDAFRVVAEDGLAVVVRGRSGRTRARYALADPAAVGRFLARLDERLGSP